MMVRNALLAVFVSVGWVLAQPAVALPKASPTASVSQEIGYTTVTVAYSRPGVKGRAIWGGLVPHGKVWRAGANEATTVEFSTDAKVGGQAVPKGKYALFIQPGEKEWIFIVSKQAKAWGSFAYDQKEDVARITVPFQAAPHQERLAFGFEDLTDSSAVLSAHWEKRKASIPIVVEFMETAKAKIKEGLPKAKPDDPYAWMGAARFYWTYKIDRKQALEWIDKSIAVKPLHNNLWAKAEMLAEDGKVAEAKTFAQQAKDAAAKDPNATSQAAIIDAAVAKWPAVKKP